MLAAASTGCRVAVSARAACAAVFPGHRHEFAYVTNAQDGTIGEYALNTCGALTALGSVRAGGAPTDVVVTADGRFAYATDQRGRIDAYRVRPDGRLAPLRPAALPAAAGSLAAVIDPRGEYVYVANSQADSISGYALDPATGALRPLPGFPLSTGHGSAPWSLGLPPSGRFLYVVERGANEVARYALDRKTGRLAAVRGGAVTSDGIYPRSIAFSPSGRFAYVANESNTIAEFAVGAADGRLTPIQGSPLVLAGEFPWQVVVAASGRFAYVVNNVGFIMEYEVNTGPGQMASEGYTAVTGGLLPLPGSPVQAGNSPYAMALDPSGQFAFAVEEYQDRVLGFRVTPSGLLSPLHGATPTGADPRTVTLVSLPASAR